MPARDAAPAGEAREGQPVQDEGIDGEQHDQRELGLQLGVGEVVGALDRALPDDRRAGRVEDDERDDDDAGDEFVRRRNARAVLRQLGQQAEIGGDDGAERRRCGEQVREDEQDREHVARPYPPPRRRDGD